MPDIRTEATEIVTGLGMLGFSTLEEAVVAVPSELVNVSASTWERLQAGLSLGQNRPAAEAALENGRAFLSARAGLRGRTPARIEWKGPDHGPGYDLLPADLRVDHVYLISCKYQSRLLINTSPSNVFDNLLQTRGTPGSTNWYSLVAPSSYLRLYDAVRRAVGDQLPEKPDRLTKEDRGRIRIACARTWPVEVEPAYREFAQEVSSATAKRWCARLSSIRERELLLWRMLRFSESPYFVLGTAGSRFVRLRIATPWDWRQQFRLKTFEVFSTLSGQPRVEWEARITDLANQVERSVQGHVEIRWSHGRFCGSPEAKIYLDTASEVVPGYYSLESENESEPLADQKSSRIASARERSQPVTNVISKSKIVSLFDSEGEDS